MVPLARTKVGKCLAETDRHATADVVEVLNDYKGQTRILMSNIIRPTYGL